MFKGKILVVALSNLSLFMKDKVNRIELLKPIMYGSMKGADFFLNFPIDMSKKNWRNISLKILGCGTNLAPQRKV